MTGGQGNFMGTSSAPSPITSPLPTKNCRGRLGGDTGAAQEQFITRMGPNGVNALVNFFRGQTW